MKNLKKLSKFKHEDEEAAFWQHHDSTDYIDWSRAKIAEFPNLKPTTKTISIRLSEHLLNELKILANREDVPYQSLMKIILSEGVARFRGLLNLKGKIKWEGDLDKSRQSREFR